MATLKFTDGPATVTLDGGLEAFVRKALEAAGGETLRVLENLAEDVRSDAATRWYSKEGVKERTGRSGQIEVVEKVSDTEVRVSVGSVDLSKAKFVHRPGRLSTSLEEITKAEYEREKNGPKARLVFHARKDRKPEVEAGHYYRILSNPDASDGKYLLPELVTKPMRAKIKASLPQIGAAIARKTGGG